MLTAGVLVVGDEDDADQRVAEVAMARARDAATNAGAQPLAAATTLTIATARSPPSLPVAFCASPPRGLLGLACDIVIVVVVVVVAMASGCCWCRCLCRRLG